MALLVVDRDARTGLHVVEVSFRQFTVFRKTLDDVIDVATGRVGLAIMDEFFNECNHFPDMFRSLRFYIRAINSQLIHVGIEFIDKPVGEFFRGGVLLIGPGYDLVIDIREITYICHFEITVFQITDDHVKGECRTGMADVAIIVGSNAADVEFYMVLFNGMQDFFLSG